MDGDGKLQRVRMFVTRVVNRKGRIPILTSPSKNALKHPHPLYYKKFHFSFGIFNGMYQTTTVLKTTKAVLFRMRKKNTRNGTDNEKHVLLIWEKLCLRWHFMPY